MLVGRFYSRRCGWNDAEPIKCFHSRLFFTENNNLDDLSGGNILAMENIEEEIRDFAKIHKDWYFYYGDTKIITQGSLD